MTDHLATCRSGLSAATEENSFRPDTSENNGCRGGTRLAAVHERAAGREVSFAVRYDLKADRP